MTSTDRSPQGTRAAAPEGDLQGEAPLGSSEAARALRSPRRNRRSKGTPGDGRGAWVLALFALPFASIGIGVLVLWVVPMLYDWSRMLAWQPVPAQVVSAVLEKRRSSGSTTHGVAVVYRYEVAGTPYEGRRAALSGAFDNLGSFQRDLALRLASAQNSGTPVAVWVNPGRPAESVVDRSLRPGLLALQMGFVVAFGGFGVGTLVWVWRLRRRATAPPGGQVAQGDQRWMAHAAWSGNRIRSDKRWEVWVAWGFAAVWGGLTVPAAVAGLPRAWSQGNLIEGGVLVLMCLVGVGLLTWAVRATADARRHGDVRLVMDPFPGCVGADVGGAIVLAGVRYGPELSFPVVLRCYYPYQSSSGTGDNDSRTREEVVWQSEGYAQVRPATPGDAGAPGAVGAGVGQGVRVAFRFEVPAGLPESGQPAGDSTHRWQVLIDSDSPALKFSRRFEVPVFATGARTAAALPDAVHHPRMQARRDAVMASVHALETMEGGVKIYQPYGRLWRHQLLWMGVGAAFLAAGVALGRNGEALAVRLAFGGMGGAMLVWGLYAVSNSLRVQLDRQGLHTERRLLGLMMAWQRIPAAEIVRLRLRESFSVQTSKRRTTYFRLEAELRNGKSVTLADSLEGRSAAERLLARVVAETGYPGGP